MISAPKSIGRRRMGVATVLSTIEGTPCSWATRAIASMSQTLPAGSPTLSQNTARVLLADQPPDTFRRVGLGEARLNALARQDV